MSMRTSVSPSAKIRCEDAAALAQLVKAWDACQERIRVISMQPRPGTAKPEPVPPKKLPFRNLPPVPPENACNRLPPQH